MNLSIVKTIAATPDPVDLATVSAYLRADLDIPSEAEHLQLLIAQAANEVERITGRVLLSSTFRQSQSDWSEFPDNYLHNRNSLRSRALELPRSPLLTVTSVKYYDEDGEQQTVSSDNYLVCTDLEPGQIYFKTDFDLPVLQTRPDAVQVVFTAGHATTIGNIPPRLKMAMLLLCREYYAGGSPNAESGDDYNRAMLILNGEKVGGWTR